MFGFIWTSAQTVRLNFTQYVFLEGENGLVQNAVPHINYLVFCCEEKVAFLCFKREILCNPSLSNFCQKLAGCLPALYPCTWQVAQPSKSCSCLYVRAGSTCRAAGPWAGVQMDSLPEGPCHPEVTRCASCLQQGCKLRNFQTWKCFILCQLLVVL